jgi:SH3 domain.
VISVKERCKVLYPYEAQNEDELTLKEEDIVVLISRDAPDKGWWKGELHGRVGLFPDNFVTVLPTTDEVSEV